MDRWKQQWTPLLPERVSEVLDRIDDDAALLEIRLRRDRPLELVFDGGDRIVYGNNKAPIVTEEELRALCARLMEYSAYAWENERKNGFITVGGCRVGLSGRMLRTSDGAAGFSSVSGICIRIVREVKGCAGPLIPQLLSDGRFCSVLVVSPPGCGKTTMLRDLIRIASDGLCGAPYCRVGVADERFELCGDANGAVVFDLGARTDVVSGVSKSDAAVRIVSTLSPTVLAMDELNDASDAAAVSEARGKGVAVFATAHGSSVGDLRLRPAIRSLLDLRVFDRIVLLEGVGNIRMILDGTGGTIAPEAV